MRSGIPELGERQRANPMNFAPSIAVRRLYNALITPGNAVEPFTQRSRIAAHIEGCP